MSKAGLGGPGKQLDYLFLGKSNLEHMYFWVQCLDCQEADICLIILGPYVPSLPNVFPGWRSISSFIRHTYFIEKKHPHV